MIMLLAFFAISCNKQKVQTVIVKTSLEEGALTGVIKLNNQKLDYKGLATQEFKITPQYPKRLSFKLNYIHTPEFYNSNFSGLKPTQISMNFKIIL